MRLFQTGVAITLMVLALAPAGASSANISHPYQSAAAVPNGSIVSLTPNRSDFVELADTGNGSRLVGVSLASSDSLIAVDAGSEPVQVATSGTASVLVSTLDGNISVGDQIAVSPFKGIGMKALPGSRVVGLAQTGFNSHSPGVTTQRVKDRNGHDVSIQLGYVQVSIVVGTYNPDASLTSLQRLIKSITGRTVSMFRIAVSLTVVAVELIVLVVLIYSAIYSGVISVGRNPMAKKAVFRSMWLVLGMAAVTLGIAGGTVILLLR